VLERGQSVPAQVTQSTKTDIRTYKRFTFIMESVAKGVEEEGQNSVSHLFRCLLSSEHMPAQSSSFYLIIYQMTEVHSQRYQDQRL